MAAYSHRPQVSILGSAEPGSAAYVLAAEAGTLLARLGITVVSGCGSPATRVAAGPAPFPRFAWPGCTSVHCCH